MAHFSCTRKMSLLAGKTSLVGWSCSCLLYAGQLVLPPGLLGEKSLMVERVVVGRKEWVGGSGFTPDMHGDTHGGEGVLGGGDVRPCSARNCVTVVVITSSTFVLCLNMTTVYLCSSTRSQAPGGISS